jgi:eukaryotic-like serine/threonine-protein kinase
VDCDDVILLLAHERTLTGVEAERMKVHLEDCEECSELARHDTDTAWRWVARLPDDALDDPDSLALPVVDPIVFAAGAQIAVGGMGKITRARDRRLGREVAIKEMLEPDLRARFEREATITARLQHPAIVPIYEAGTWPNGGAFYTMRLVEGGTLAHAIDKAEGLAGRLALLPHVVAVTEALAYAHSRRIIHRDLKPQNVLVGEFGEAVVIDWGLAKELDHDVDAATSRVLAPMPDLTLHGSVIGTPCFMAPEQARGEDLDERADVFALGSILYNVLAGQPPYWDGKRDTAEQLIEAVLARPPTPVATHAPDAPADLCAVVERAMQREPGDRYATAKEMAEELRRFQSGQLLVSREYRIRDLLARWVGRHKAAVAVGGIASVALAVVGVLALVNITRSRDAERDARVLSELAQGDTTRSVAALLEEQGRSELVGGHRDRALAYLAEAYKRGRDTPALRYMLAASTRELDLLVATIKLSNHDRHHNLAFLSDGRLAIWTVGGLEDSTLDLADAKGNITQHFVTGDVSRGEFSPDGRRLVTLSDTAATVWDVATGKKLWSIAGKFQELSLDTSSVLVAIFPGASGASIYELETGTKRLEMSPKYAVDTVAFDDGGAIIVAIGEEGLCTFFALDRKTNAYAEIPFGKTGLQLLDAAFTGERLEDRVMMTTKENEVLLWTLKVPFRSIGGHRARITAIAASPKHHLFASADAGGDVKLWGYEGNLLGETNDAKQAIRELQFSNDGSMLIGTGDDPHTYVWNTALGVQGELLAPEDNYQSSDAIAIARDDSLIATYNEGGDRVRIWRKPTANLIAQRKGVSFALTDRAVMTTDGHQLTVQDLATGKVVRQFPVAHAPLRRRDGLQNIDRERLLVTADGTRVMTFDRTGAGVYELATGAVVRAFDVDATNNGEVTTWVFSSQGHYVLELGDTVVRLHEVATGKIIVSSVVSTETGSLGDISPDESRLVLVSDSPNAWKLPSGTTVEMPPLPVPVTKTIRPNGGVVTISPGMGDLVFAPAGDRMIILGLNAPFVIDAAGKLVARLELAKLDVEVDTVRFSGDGKRVVTQVQDLAAVWNTDTGEALFTIPDTAARAVAISADGARIATGSNDGTIRIWDDKGRMLEQIHAHRAAISALKISKDGTRLIAQGDDDETTIWDIHLEQRSPDAIAKIAAEATPWHVVGGTLVLRKSK